MIFLNYIREIKSGKKFPRKYEINTAILQKMSFKSKGFF